MGTSKKKQLKHTRPRKRDADATRAAILEVAKDQFARLGYDNTALRHIAADAGIDVALIKRYFGGKEGLFTAALNASFPPDFSHWNRETFAHDFATMMAGHAHEDEDRTHRFRFLLRAAASPNTAPGLSSAIQERFLAPIRDWLGGDGAQARARVLAATVIGFLVERLVRDKPLAGRERKEFIDRAAEVFGVIMSPRASE